MVTASDQVSSSILPLASQRALLGVPQYLTRSCHETRSAEKDRPFHNIECSGADLPSARHKLDVCEVPSLLPWVGRQSQTIGSIQTDSLWGVIFVKRHNTKVTQQTWKKIPKTLHVTPCHNSNCRGPHQAHAAWQILPGSAPATQTYEDFGHKNLMFMSWFTGVQANPQDFHEIISHLVMLCLPRSSGLSPDVQVNRTRPESPAKSYLDWESPAGASTRSLKAWVQAIHQRDYGELPWNAGPQEKSHRPERIKSGCHILYTQRQHRCSKHASGSAMQIETILHSKWTNCSTTFHIFNCK